MIDKNKIVMNYLGQCPDLADLFFNFGETNNGDTIFTTSGNDFIYEEYIDGTKLKWYDFTIIQFKPANTFPNDSLNADALFDFAKIAKWVEEQDLAENYPDFGDKCEIHEFYVVPSSATVAGRDNLGAKYMMTCRIEYTERI